MQQSSQLYSLQESPESSRNVLPKRTHQTSTCKYHFSTISRSDLSENAKQNSRMDAIEEKAGWMRVQTHKCFEVILLKKPKNTNQLNYPELLINTSYQSKAWTFHLTRKVSFKGESYKTCQEHVSVIYYPKTKRKK